MTRFVTVVTVVTVVTGHSAAPPGARSGGPVEGTVYHMIKRTP